MLSRRDILKGLGAVGLLPVAMADEKVRLVRDGVGVLAVPPRIVTPKEVFEQGHAMVGRLWRITVQKPGGEMQFDGWATHVSMALRVPNPVAPFDLPPGHIPTPLGLGGRGYDVTMEFACEEPPTQRCFT